MLVLAKINTLLACSQMLAKTILYPFLETLLEYRKTEESSFMGSHILKHGCPIIANEPAERRREAGEAAAL